MTAWAPETFSADEADVLRRYVTNLEGPVFALVNLPEVVKGALFARYSRSAKSLRRLFLDEFVSDLDVTGDESIDATVGVRRAEELYERVFVAYGDDSVAQLGGVHLACEQASNILTKVLEWGRLMAYLEQSTRYVPYDSRLATGHYRYYRDPDLLASPFGARYVGEMDRVFDTYSELLPRMQSWLSRRFPKQAGDSDLVYRQSIRAQALDALRGLLPAASLSNVGLYGTGQSYEQLLLRMRVHPLPEARAYAELMLGELRKVIPSFLRRVDRPDRGGAWSAYLDACYHQTEEIAHRLTADLAGGGGGTSGPPGASVGGPGVTLVEFDPSGEDKVLAAILFPHANVPEDALVERVAALTAAERAALLHAYVGERTNRRHRPGRAFEATAYRFEIVCDYGAFRDLQRHRMLTVDWQRLGPDLGFEIPASVVEAGLADPYEESLARSADLYNQLLPEFPEQAAYALALAYRIRFAMHMNAREAMHIIELRSGQQGHPSYRLVAQAMHDLIDRTAGHHAIASAMQFVDHSSYDLSRLDAERHIEKRRVSGEPAPRPVGGNG